MAFEINSLNSGFDSNGKSKKDEENSKQNLKSNAKNNSAPLKLPNPKEETKYTDSLSRYISDPNIKQSQIQLVRELLKHSDPEKASHVMQTTAVKLIKDSNIGVRRIIAWSLRHSKDKIGSIRLLLGSIKGEKNWIVLEEMILSLAHISSSLTEEEKKIYGKTSDEVIQTIVSNLSHNRHPVRISAIKGCTILKIKEARCKLEEISVLDPVISVRDKAKAALEQLQK